MTGYPAAMQYLKEVEKTGVKVRLGKRRRYPDVGAWCWQRSLRVFIPGLPKLYGGLLYGGRASYSHVRMWVGTGLKGPATVMMREFPREGNKAGPCWDFVTELTMGLVTLEQLWDHMGKEGNI